MQTSLQTKIVRSNRKTLSLRVLPNETVVVTAPMWTPQIIIEDFVAKNQGWIASKLQQFQHHKITTEDFTDKEYYFLGGIYHIKLGNYTEVSLGKDAIYFPLALKFRIKKEMSNWYIRNAKTIITQYVESLSKEMKTEYRSISFSDTKSKWGSCTHDNRLQFNWRLVMAPVLVVRYVVIHELAHTIEKNHSQSFWRLVRNFSPSYRQNRKWLHEHGDLLFIDKFPV